MKEDELDVELRKLDVKEDLGEDSDVTPTNSPTPLNPSKFHVLNNASSNTSGFFEGDFSRFSSYDDSAMRTSSSLSWGEDEFEGEATRTVTALFDQLDQMIYNDASNKVVKFPNVKLKRSRDRKQERMRDNRHKKTNMYPPKPDFLASGESSEEESLDSASARSSNIGPPSPALINECKEWVDNFPHLRVLGVGIDLIRYEKIESKLLLQHKKISDEDSEVGKEELYAEDGEYEDKLIFRTLKPEINKGKKKEKSKAPNTSSLDRELVKEYLVNKAFEHVWPSVCQIIEPLAKKYAEHVISQSAQVTSISRDSSSVSRGELPNIDLREMKKEDFPKPLQSLRLVDSGSKPMLINSRPSSAVNILSSKVPKIKNESIEELSNLKISDETSFSRSMSASRARELSSKSSTSFPSIPSLGKNSRPVSSKSGNHLLTPMPTVENRPQSTSSFTRLRHTDKYSKIKNRAATIEEGVSNSDNLESTRSSPSPPWSRHNSFLPNINVKSKTKPKSISPTLSLSPYSKSLSAISRTAKSEYESPRIDSCSEQAEPFVSWVVSRVEEQSIKGGKKAPRNKVTK